MRARDSTASKTIGKRFIVLLLLLLKPHRFIGVNFGQRRPRPSFISPPFFPAVKVRMFSTVGPQWAGGKSKKSIAQNYGR